MFFNARERIVRRININEKNGCWDFSGCIQSNGYGRITYKRKTMGAHRLAYLAFIGEIPTGMDVCHKCDNRRCVNPAHLFIGSRKKNMEDCVRKGRQAKGDRLSALKSGEKTNFAKLTERQVLEIRERIKNKEKISDIAKKFYVSDDNIRRIARRDTWRHI